MSTEKQVPLPRRWLVKVNITEVRRTATVMASSRAEARQKARDTLWEYLTADAEQYKVQVVGGVVEEP